MAPQIHPSPYHHHRDDVTAPPGRPNLRSRLHYSHIRGGGGETQSPSRASGGIGKKNPTFDIHKHNGDDEPEVQGLLYVTLDVIARNYVMHTVCLFHIMLKTNLSYFPL
jgi:hypothetical protein